MVLADIPEEYVPDCLQGVREKTIETEDAFFDECVKVIDRRPQVLLGDLGQHFMDTVQTPEGIALTAGNLVAIAITVGYTVKNAKPKVSDTPVDDIAEREIAEEVNTAVEAGEESLDEVEQFYNDIFEQQYEISEEYENFLEDLTEVPEAIEGNSAATTKPNQVHHYATNKSKTYTQAFKDITDKYGLDLDDAWNKELLPHQGRHPNAYHDFVLEEMRNIDNIANGNKDIFLELYESEIKSIIRENPDMLYSNYWNG